MTDKPPAEIYAYEFPWYRRVAHRLTDLVYGDNANAQQGAWMNKLAGPENPINLPGKVAEGTDRMREGYRMGNYGEMAGGALEVVEGLAPAVGAIPLAGGRLGRLRGPFAERAAAQKAEQYGSQRPLYEPSGNATFDAKADRMAQGSPQQQAKLAEGMRDAGGTRKDLERGFNESLGPIDWYVYHTRKEGWPSALQPGHLMLQGANVALQDKLWNLGIMPWSWNQEGSLQQDLRNTLAGAQDEVNRQRAYRQNVNQSPLPLAPNDK